MEKRLWTLRNVYKRLITSLIISLIVLFAVTTYAAYMVPANEVGTTLSNDFVYGTDAVIQISSLTDFPTGGGVVRIDDGTHWCLVKYGSVDAGTVELRTLTTPVADYESTAAHTFAAGVEVWLVCAADYIMQFITALPDTTTDHGIPRFDGVIGKIQNSTIVIDDSNQLGIGDATPDASLDVEGDAFIGDATNYTEIKTDGEINLHGTARVKNHVRVAAPSWEKGATAPTADLIGITSVLGFDTNNDDEAYYSLIVPFKMVTGATIEVEVDWTYVGDDTGTVCWNMDYINIAPGEDVGGGITTITKTTAGNHTAEILVRTTLATGITGAVAGDILSLRLWRDISEDDLAPDADMIEVHFHFICDKLGEAT